MMRGDVPQLLHISVKLGYTTIPEEPPSVGLVVSVPPEQRYSRTRIYNNMEIKK